MKIASCFLTWPEVAGAVYLSVDGETVAASMGDTVAAALLANSGEASRRTAKGAERTAFCMMGVCFDCLVEVDGRPNMQGCTVTVRDGMVLRRQHGLRNLAWARGDE